MKVINSSKFSIQKYIMFLVAEKKLYLRFFNSFFGDHFFIVFFAPPGPLGDRFFIVFLGLGTGHLDAQFLILKSFNFLTEILTFLLREMLRRACHGPGPILGPGRGYRFFIVFFAANPTFFYSFFGLCPSRGAGNRPKKNN